MSNCNCVLLNWECNIELNANAMLMQHYDRDMTQTNVITFKVWFPQQL